MKFKLSINNLNKIIVSDKIQFERNNAFSEIQSLFITDSKKVIVFYGSSSSSNHYTILVLDEDLSRICEEDIEDSYINIYLFHSCIH